MDEYIQSLRYFKESDIYLVPFCLAIIYGILIFTRRKYEGTFYHQYFIKAFNWRLVCVVAYAMVIWFYYGSGDSSMYYRSVLAMSTAVGDDLSLFDDIFFAERLHPEHAAMTYFMYDPSGTTHFYMATTSNYSVARFALPFSLIFFRSFLCINFCFCLFSFAGCWRLFKMFCELYPALHKKFAIAILFLPTVLFWGGSLMKDSLCLGAMGLLIYAIYQVFFKRRKIVGSLFMIAFTGIILLYTKPYILLCLTPAFVLWLFLHFRSRILNPVIRKLSGGLLAILCAGAGAIALQRLTESELASSYSSEKLLETMQAVQTGFESDKEGSGSSYSLGSVESTGDLITLLPLGFVATFFRPFLWEVRNPLMILSALESFAFLVLTIMVFRRLGFKTFFRISFSDPIIVFCMLFSVSFAAIVGATTTNFGALARYKLPCISLYLIMLFIIMYKSGKFSNKYIFHPKLL